MIPVVLVGTVFGRPVVLVVTVGAILIVMVMMPQQHEQALGEATLQNMHWHTRVLDMGQ